MTGRTIGIGAVLLLLMYAAVMVAGSEGHTIYQIVAVLCASFCFSLLVYVDTEHMPWRPWQKIATNALGCSLGLSSFGLLIYDTLH